MLWLNLRREISHDKETNPSIYKFDFYLQSYKLLITAQTVTRCKAKYWRNSKFTTKLPNTTIISTGSNSIDVITIVLITFTNSARRRQ